MFPSNKNNSINDYSNDSKNKKYTDQAYGHNSNTNK